MKAEDLRIGNIVLYNTLLLEISGINSPQPYKDVRFNNKWIIELFDGASFITTTLKEIKPVLITKEMILQYDGWQGGTSWGNYWHRVESCGIRYIADSKKWRITWNGSEIGERIKHLHEYQNAFKLLSNTELKLKK